MKSNYKKHAFALNKLVIVLVVLIVVIGAIFVIPNISDGINQYFLAKKANDIETKFTQSTTRMVEMGDMKTFSSTQDFVKEFQNYLPIDKICNAAQLSKCWAYDEIVLNNGATYKIADIKTGKQLRMKHDDNSDYTDNVVGILTEQGIPMIISYNRKCPKFDKSRNYTWTGSTNSTTNCLAVVFDVNGQSKPNQVGKDVVLFNANGIGEKNAMNTVKKVVGKPEAVKNCAINVNGICFGKPFVPTSLTYQECKAQKKDLGIRKCKNLDNKGGDAWAGAVKACGGVKNMPSKDELIALASEFYGEPVTDDSEDIILDTRKSANAGFKTSPRWGFFVWSNTEFSDALAYGYTFGPTYAYWNIYSTYSGRNIKNQAVCVNR